MDLSFLSKSGKIIVESYIKKTAKDPSTFVSFINDNDEMYIYLLNVNCNGNKDWAYLRYLQSGKQMVDTLRQIVEHVFGSFDNISSFLDFACGYGRFMRFLIQEIPPNRIWASDIYSDAVKFQVKQFGVHGEVSTDNPEDYTMNNQYDCIFVASLFSHLPRQTFAHWLRKLYDMLSDRGILIFSVHDIDVMPQHLKNIRHNGIVFVPQSESSSLNKDQYGTAYVTEEFVRQAISQLSDQEVPYHRIRKGLWLFQDLYLVPCDHSRNFSSLDISLGLEGYIDTCTVTDDGEISISGWAVDFGTAITLIKDVEILINGQIVQQCFTDGERPDVAKYFSDERVSKSGWSCCFKYSGVNLQDHLIVKIVNKQDDEKILFSGILAAIHGQGGIS